MQNLDIGYKILHGPDAVIAGYEQMALQQKLEFLGDYWLQGCLGTMYSS